MVHSLRFEVEKIIRRIRAGEKLDTIDKTISMSMQGKKYSSSNFLIFNVVINDVDRATWTGSILRDEGTIYLRAGVIKDILEYLVSIGIKEKPKPYYYIEYVAKLPLTDRTDIAWILTADDGEGQPTKMSYQLGTLTPMVITLKLGYNF